MTVVCLLCAQHSQSVRGSRKIVWLYLAVSSLKYWKKSPESLLVFSFFLENMYFCFGLTLFLGIYSILLTVTPDDWVKIWFLALVFDLCARALLSHDTIKDFTRKVIRPNFCDFMPPSSLITVSVKSSLCDMEYGARNWGFCLQKNSTHGFNK